MLTFIPRKPSQSTDKLITKVVDGRMCSFNKSVPDDSDSHNDPNIGTLASYSAGTKCTALLNSSCMCLYETYVFIPGI